MDDPQCDKELLFRTYEYFSIINRMVSQWKSIYQKFIRTKLEKGRSFRLLDVGFGGGDILRELDNWINKDGFEVELIGIDTDKRALEYANNQKWPRSVCFEEKTMKQVSNEERTFDFVISNHLMHHLSEPELMKLLKDAQKVCKGTVIFNDIERGDLAYFVFDMATRFFFPASKSFLNVDGRISVKRSYTCNELGDIISNGWEVRRMFPYRLLLLHQNHVK